MATFAWQHLRGNIWVATFGWHGRWPVLQKTGSILFPKRPPDPRKMAPRKKRAAFPQSGDPSVWGFWGASWEAMGYAWPHLNPERRVPPPLAGPPGRDPEPPPASEVPRPWAAAQRAH